MDHATIIKELGGAPAIAARLGCHPSRPHRWRADNCIPAGRWLELADLAAAIGRPAITVAALAAAAPKPCRQVAA